MNYLDSLRQENPELYEYSDNEIIADLPNINPQVFGDKAPEQVKELAYQDNNFIADAGRLIASGAKRAAGDVVTGAEQLFDADWSLDESLRQSAEETRGRVDPRWQEAINKAGFREESENSLAGFTGSMLESFGSMATFAPVMAASAAAAPLTGGASLPAGIALVGTGITNGLMIGGGSYQDTVESLDSLSDDAFKESPLFNAYLDETGDFQAARQKMTQDLADEAWTRGATVGGASGTVIGPMLSKALRGGQGAVKGALRGGTAEGLQELGESGSESFSREKATATVENKAVDPSIVGRDALFGATVGFGAGSVPGGTVGALTQNDVDLMAAQAAQAARERGGDELDAELAETMVRNDLEPLVPTPFQPNAEMPSLSELAEQQPARVQPTNFDPLTGQAMRPLEGPQPEQTVPAQQEPALQPQQGALLEPEPQQPVVEPPDYQPGIPAAQEQEQRQIAELQQEAKQLEKRRPQKLPARGKQIEPDMELSTAVAVAGGLNLDEAKAQGLDPKDTDRVGIRRVFTKKGQSLDGMAETLNQYGFRDEQGNPLTANSMIDVLEKSLGGQEVYSTANSGEAAERQLIDQELDDIDRQIQSIRENYEYDIGEPPKGKNFAAGDDTERQLGYAILEADLLLPQERVDSIIAEADTTEAAVEALNREIANARPRARQEGPGDSQGYTAPPQGQGTAPQGQGQESSRVSETVNTDLFGAVPEKEQSLADEQRKRDEKRSPGTDVPADVDGGLFSNQQRQVDITDIDTAANEAATSPENDLAEPSKAPQPDERPLRKYEVNPDDLVFRESEQNRLDEVRELFPEDEGYYPIVTVQTDSGAEILDGHNRARIAQERGNKIQTVELPEQAYSALQEAGYDDTEISYAALTEAGEHEAASAINQQFPGAGVASRGDEAAGLLADAVSSESSPRNQGAGIDAAANEAATSPENDLAEPSEAQIEAGNYKKGKIRVSGLDISIENPKGSTRSGTSPDGKKWSNTLKSHYGYIRRTEGADGEQVDVFVGPKPEADTVYVVDQVNQDGSFDEHKVLMGFPDQQAAEKGYLENYQKGWTLGPVTPMSVEELKGWLSESDNTKPVSKELTAKGKLQSIKKARDTKRNQQALKDQTITEQYETETGELVEVEQSADAVFRQIDKRLSVMDKLLGCVMG